MSLASNNYFNNFQTLSTLFAPKDEWTLSEKFSEHCLKMKSYLIIEIDSEKIYLSMKNNHLWRS